MLTPVNCFRTSIFGLHQTALLFLSLSVVAALLTLTRPLRSLSLTCQASQFLDAMNFKF